MPTQQIETQFVEELLAATRDVFKTMVFQDVETSSPIKGDALRPGANVVGTVAFAGKTSGLVAFYSTLEGATAITASMLGIDPGSVNGELPDAIGELTNMIAGSFRTRIAGVRGETWAISVPTVPSDRISTPSTSATCSACCARSGWARRSCSSS